MASRSFKPASFLARPTFARTHSGSSVKSTTSEDSLSGTLRSLALESPGATSPIPDEKENTRKKSDPIAIQISRNHTHVVTPLTARGDLPGGYFPNHEPDPKARRPSGFSTYSIADLALKNHAPLDTPGAMSATSSPSLSPTMLSPSVPAPLLIPMGKYHPSNYKSPANTAMNTRPSTANSLAPPPMNLSTAKLRARKERPKMHKRQTSEVRQKLEKYQKDMVAQAQKAANKHAFVDPKEPNSPKLSPMMLQTPGIMTPLELGGGEEADFLTAGDKQKKAREDIRIRELEDMENEEIHLGGHSLMLG